MNAFVQFFLAHSREKVSSYYNLLDILKFDNIFKLKVALFAHKIINDPTGIPTIFSGTLPLSSDCHSHYTRFVSDLNYHRPQINNNYGASTFSFFALKIWETIPLELKKLCYYHFSKHFRLYLLNSQSVSKNILGIHPCIIIIHSIHHEARMLVLTWVLNNTAMAAIQLFCQP